MCRFRREKYKWGKAPVSDRYPVSDYLASTQTYILKEESRHKPSYTLLFTMCVSVKGSLVMILHFENVRLG